MDIATKINESGHDAIYVVRSQNELKVCPLYHFHTAFLIEGAGQVGGYCHGNDLHGLVLQMVSLHKVFTANHRSRTPVRGGAV